MLSAYMFTDPRLGKLDGFQVEIDENHERADIVLNRPPYNIVTMPQRDQLRLVFETLDEDARVRVIVIRSIGEHFSSGGNIGGFMEATPEHVSKLAWNIAAPARCAKPVIVANRGYCFGVGFELSLACDFRIAADTARLGDTSGKFGLLPDEGGAWFFPRMMGLDRALKMTLLHEVYTAAEAMTLGLVTEVVPASELKAKSLAFAREIAKRAPLAVRLAKNMMRKGLDSSLENSLDDAALSVMIANPSQDVREGSSAFFAKRDPKFEGR